MNSAILLLGATGTGKTPLGECLAKSGFSGKRCFHFDFGANLRYAAEGGFSKDLMPEKEVQFIRNLLERGALLEDGDFYIAEDILCSFEAEQGVGAEGVIVLNGLPRHVGQAQALESIVQVELVVYLDSTPDVVLKRIEIDSGGDRGGRVDDSLPEIINKLDIFHKRTVPLLDHYREKEVRVVSVDVGVETTAADILSMIKEMKGK